MTFNELDKCITTKLNLTKFKSNDFNKLVKVIGEELDILEMMIDDITKRHAKLFKVLRNLKEGVSYGKIEETRL